MTLVYILFFCLPFMMIIIAFGAIIGAAMSVGRKGKRVYLEAKPYVEDLQSNVNRAQKMSADIGGRGKKLQETFVEIGGRWEFIRETVEEATTSPVMKVAGAAGRFIASREAD